MSQQFESAQLASPSDPLHIVSQVNQPYGSVRRCCSNCGAMCWPGQVGTAYRWIDDWDQWNLAPDKCTL